MTALLSGPDAVEPAASDTRFRPSPWTAFRRDRAAMLGLAVVVASFLLALTAPWVARLG